VRGQPGFFAGFMTAVVFGLAAIAGNNAGWAYAGGAMFNMIACLAQSFRNPRSLTAQGFLGSGLLGSLGWFLGDPLLWHLNEEANG
jgi:hypothetical protein